MVNFHCVVKIKRGNENGLYRRRCFSCKNMYNRAPCSATVVSDAGTVNVSDLYPRVVGFQLGILSPEEIERLKAKVVTEHAVYNKNLPKLDGPNDPALGPSDRRIRCATCRNSWFKCPGHTGVIRLPIPLYHVGFVDPVFKILQAFCWVCSNPLGDEDDSRVARHANCRGIVRFNQVFAMGRGRFRCSHCSAPQPKYSKSGMVITRAWKPKQLVCIDELSEYLGASARRLFTPSDALDILRNISDDHVRLMGMDPLKSHPAWMILQNMVVLPPNARPAIMASEGSKRRGQDDTTNQTQDIVKACRTLRRSIFCVANGVTNKRGGNGGAGGGGGNSTAGATPLGPTAAAGTAAAKKASAKEKEQSENVAEACGDAENSPVFVTEFLIKAGGGCFSSEEVIALRFALHDAVCSVTPEQASVIWTTHAQLCERLQNEVTVMYDNGGRYAPQARQRTGVPKKALSGRLAGKQGRFRCNMVAKRTDQNARSVIKPDRTLDIDQLGVPSCFMNTLTKPEEVNARNIEWLTTAVALGPGATNGAARILHLSGEMTQLHLVEDRKAIKLQYGDIVERHLIDNDIGCFNRQPSLHKLSFMAHRLKRVSGEAFCVPLGVMGPYNADCDGDEMNLHILQSLPADAEARELMAVSRNVMNPQTNAPCLSLVQDARVGAMLITRKSTRLTREQLHQCMGVIRYKLPGKANVPPPAGTDADSGEPYWTGKQLVTLLLPSGIFLEKRVRGAAATVGPDDPAERYVLIENGVLLHGTLCKATIGPGSGGIIHRIVTAYGQDAAIRFLSDFQRIIYEWLPTHGLTMGLNNCIVPEDVKRAVYAETDRVDSVVERLTREAKELQAFMTTVESARIEAHILTILTSALDYTSRLVLANVDEDSGFHDMVAAGSKGSTNNVAQVKACLGQQVVEGERPPPSCISQRTLPMFPPGAFSAAARGFIARSYLDGMRSYEYFFHMMGGREGLVATAVKTAETGYKYRSMAKAMEGNVVQWDGSVRTSQGHVIEFIAGGDGMKATSLERVDLPVLNMSNADVHRACNSMQPYTTRVLYLRDVMRAALLTPMYSELHTRVLLPVNIREELHRVQFDLTSRRTRFEVKQDEDSDECLIAHVQDIVKKVVPLFPSREAMAALELAILFELRPNVLRAHGVDAQVLKHVIEPEIVQRTFLALMQPGDSVGIVSAQSIGEPSTQFTLNAFHQAGLIQRRMTVGVPRLKELLHASETIRTPSMLIPFRDNALPKSTRDRMACTLQFLCLDIVLHSSYPLLDPPGDGVTQPLTTLYKDHALMTHVSTMYGTEVGESLSPWIVRFVLNRATLSEHGFTPEAVAKAIGRQIKTTPLLIVYSEPNMTSWVIRVRVNGDTSERAARDLHAEIRDTVLLGGIDGIRHSRVISVPQSTVDAVTGHVTKTTEQVIDTDGTALMKVATRDWADWENTITNDVQEITRTLGLAAARAVLFAELDRVISYDGGYVDARHIRQVVNTMTHRGYVMPLTRHGINRVDFSVLQRASFEESTEMMYFGALGAELDPLRGVCETIIFGQKPPIGTGTTAVQEDTSREWAGHATTYTPRDLVASREQDLLRGAKKHFREARASQGNAGPAPASLRRTKVFRPPVSTAARPEVKVGLSLLERRRARGMDGASSNIVKTGTLGTNAVKEKASVGVMYRPSSPTDEMLDEL
jgi:DNA-directed RNA polymerase beta' subunit